MNITDIIEKFEQIRDVPYKIPLSTSESDDCCSGKSKRLLELFKNNGYEARYRVGTFDWSDLNIPNELKRVLQEEECTHSYVEVKIGDEWKIVDATWDKSLINLFKINDWDGRSNTVVAVPIKKLFSPEESAKIMQESLSEESINLDLKKNGSFYKEFNKWLNKNRTH